LGNKYIAKLNLKYLNPSIKNDTIQKLELKQKLISIILGNNEIVDKLLKRSEIIFKIN